MMSGYYKVLSLVSPVSGSEQSTLTPQSVSSFNILKTEKRVSQLPTIVESPKIKVHCLSSDSESGSEENSDSEDVAVVASADDFTSGSVGAQDSDIQYLHFHENIDIKNDGVVKSEDDSHESFSPSQRTRSEKIVMAFEWLASSNGIACTIGDSDLITSETPSLGSDSNNNFKCTP